MLSIAAKIVHPIADMLPIIHDSGGIQAVIAVKIEPPMVNNKINIITTIHKITLITRAYNK